MFPEALFLTMHPAEAGGKKEKMRHPWDSVSCMKVFGILQIRPAHGCKIAGAFFCCGEATVRSYSSQELNCVCMLHWLSPALPGMLSTFQPSVQHNSYHSPVVLGKVLFCFTRCPYRGMFTLLGGHPRDEAAPWPCSFPTPCMLRSPRLPPKQ